MGRYSECNVEVERVEMVSIHTEKLLAMKIRLHKLKNNGRNDDSPGVVRKLERQIRQIEKMEG